MSSGTQNLFPLSQICPTFSQSLFYLEANSTFKRNDKKSILPNIIVFMTVCIFCFYFLIKQKGWSYQFDHQTTSFGKLRLVLSSLGLICQSQPTNLRLSIYKLFILYHMNNHLLALISDVSIVFCFDIWYARI